MRKRYIMRKSIIAAYVTVALFGTTICFAGGEGAYSYPKPRQSTSTNERLKQLENQLANLEKRIGHLEESTQTIRAIQEEEDYEKRRSYQQESP
jgi:hypothetical protein